MTDSSDIKEQINEQIESGFTKPEIVKNLVEKGYNEKLVNTELTAIIKQSKAASNTGSEGGNTKGVVIGVLFIIVACVRFARYANGGTIFLGIGVVTAIGMAIYFMTKKK